MMGRRRGRANGESGEERAISAPAVELSPLPAYIGPMRIPTALVAALFLAAPALASAPPLKALSGWRAGQWRVSELGGHPAAAQCVGNPEAVLLAGRSNASCRFSVIQDDANVAVVTYRCGDGRQGRTEIRRDTGDLLTVDAQGVESGRPFASRTEWARAGHC